MKTGLPRRILAVVMVAFCQSSHSALAETAIAAQPPEHIRSFIGWALNAETVKPPYSAVLDKAAATVYLFDQDGRLQASSPVLLGSARGDDSVPGIGNRKIRDIRPFERTTPAGRFPSEPGLNMQDEDIVWVDYDAAISMHRVRPLKGQRRLERLASPTPADNRISYGCINVPAAFYDRWIAPGLGRTQGVVYVLPERRSVHRQFRAPLDF